MRKPLGVMAASLLLSATAMPTYAADSNKDLRAELERMQQEIDALRTEMAADKNAIAAPNDSEDGIQVGGVVRFNYTYTDYRNNAASKANRRRGGEGKFDLLGVTFNGKVSDVYLSAEYRHFEYMDVVRKAWVGYDFTDTLHGQLGIHQVPFGILPYASHSYYFNSNYYMGLEDDYDFGLKLIHDDGPLNLQAAFYLNDEMNGSTSNKRYSYDALGAIKKGTDFGEAKDTGNLFDEDGVITTLDSKVSNLRAAWTFGHGTAFSTEVGVSGQYGRLMDDDGYNMGDQYAYAAHLVGNYDRWNVQLQVTHYDNKIGDEYDRMIVGAYAGYDTIARRATSYTGNVAYSLPVQIGPISTLTFYNDYFYITDKPGDLKDTWMNVTGMSVAAGAIFAYLDIVNAKNQPFIGGSMGEADGEKHNLHYNFNVGYYF
ncbi:MAG TPA: hypothetical protein VK099_06155 [Alcanivoracaceae bacterium]|nr:hypothetical protein [Alcanivoracaceae bacterium]